jgi:lysozyme family protein
MIVALLKREGGYTNDPQDSGGETKFGISKRQFPHLDIRNLTEEQAIEIYQRLYLDGPKISSLPTYLQPVMLDFAVNSGPMCAIQKLQKVLGVTEDGVIGPETLSKIDLTYADQRWLVNAVIAERVKMICSVVIKAPKQLKFLRGWVNRAFEFLA